ncbi:MAG: phosphate butyryltransferase [Clostridiales bacterium]|nr:MAG: phosphate butyryltransferase [Clostridiales bacterium]
MINSFELMLKIAKERGPKKVAVALAADHEVLSAIDLAYKKGIITAVLIDDKNEIEKVASKHNIDISKHEIIDISDKVEASRKAVSLVSSGNADILMKGLVDTSIILKAVLDKEIGLRTGSVLSHVAVFDSKYYHKLLFVTDAAMNIAPDLDTKKKIIDNAASLANALDLEKPNVAVICAKEKVNPKMSATVDAGELVKMYEEGKFENCVVAGPFALDNAISKEAAEIKGVKHMGAGDADILLCPDIEAGNILYKALSFLGGASSAGIILGAKAPVVLTSRADSDETKLHSIALAVMQSAKNN